MARRCTTTMLMMAYLATQLAMVPHAHGASENQSSDHNARPHVHISWFGHIEHSHDDGCAYHDECDGSYSQPISFHFAPAHDHDSDAIYLPNDAGVSLPVKSVVAPSNFQDVSTLAVATTRTPTAVCETWAAADFSDKCSPGRPLYLVLRALRI